MLKSVGFDIDGVLTDICSFIVRYINDNLNMPLFNRDDIITYDIFRKVGLTERQVETIFNNPDTYENLPLMPYTVESLNYFLNNGYKLNFITARNYSLVDITYKFLVDLLHTHNFSLYFVPRNYKTSFIRTHNIHFYIDDNLDTCLDTSRYCYSFIYAAPYNNVNPITLFFNSRLFRVENLLDYFYNVDTIVKYNPDREVEVYNG